MPTDLARDGARSELRTAEQSDNGRDRETDKATDKATDKVADEGLAGILQKGQQVKDGSREKGAEAHLPQVELRVLQKGETTRETMTIDGQQFEYHVRVPENYNPKKPMPLILAFHGYGDERGQGDVAAGATGMEETTGLSKRAEKDGFIVAYLNGNPDEKNAWNNGQWFFSKRDDVKFTKAVMDGLSQDLNVDQSRIYMVGFSNGASFVHRAAGALADRVAAVADVSGWMTGQENAAAKGVSVLKIHSEDDRSVPFGGRPIWQGVVMKPSEQTFEHYRKINDFAALPEKSLTIAANGSEVLSYRSKDERGTEIKSIFIEREGHLWFGGKGNENAPINATDEVLEFFKGKRKAK
jgi:polyhydroxybutyrate depolymerase